MKKEIKCKKHDKVYASYYFGNESGSNQEWICRKCGEKGTDFFPAPKDEYTEICQKFGK
jgi:hypothetical protein